MRLRLNVRTGRVLLDVDERGLAVDLHGLGDAGGRQREIDLEHLAELERHVRTVLPPQKPCRVAVNSYRPGASAGNR